MHLRCYLLPPPFRKWCRHPERTKHLGRNARVSIFSLDTCGVCDRTQDITTSPTHSKRSPLNKTRHGKRSGTRHVASPLFCWISRFLPSCLCSLLPISRRPPYVWKKQLQFPLKTQCYSSGQGNKDTSYPMVMKPNDLQHILLTGTCTKSGIYRIAWIWHYSTTREGPLMASLVKTKTVFLFAWVAWFHNQYHWAYFLFSKVRFLYLKAENLWCYNICQNTCFLFHASLHLQFESDHLDSTFWCFLPPTVLWTLWYTRGLLARHANTSSVSDLTRPEWSFSLSLNSLWYRGEKSKYFQQHSTNVDL